jgi:hypothetical protein
MLVSFSIRIPRQAPIRAPIAAKRKQKNNVYAHLKVLLVELDKLQKLGVYVDT